MLLLVTVVACEKEPDYIDTIIYEKENDSFIARTFAEDSKIIFFSPENKIHTFILAEVPFEGVILINELAYVDNIPFIYTEEIMYNVYAKFGEKDRMVDCTFKVLEGKFIILDNR